ncbi:MAG: SLBB domain-containing protein, partial [Rhodospirillaceae bacterium]|nr:SLBB domain-containing protein [Rhodospirillaceae bacterium]
RFIRRGEPLTSRIVTVTGSGVANAANVEVPIGTPIRDLIEFCGGYRGEVARLILGGNMMGYALPGDDVPITKAGNCIVAAHSEEVRETFGEWPCIRCGDCAEVCPPRLLPQELLRAATVRDFDRLDTLGLNDCIECGCCDVACPSQIPLTERFRQAKQARAVALRRAAIAELADKRHRRKLARLAAQAEDVGQQQDDLIAAIGSEAGRAMIEAAVARASRRRGESETAQGL